MHLRTQFRSTSNNHDHTISPFSLRCSSNYVHNYESKNLCSWTIVWPNWPSRFPSGSQVGSSYPSNFTKNCLFLWKTLCDWNGLYHIVLVSISIHAYDQCGWICSSSNASVLPKMLQSSNVKGSVDRSRPERHFRSLRPCFPRSWLQIFQHCLSWTSSFDLVVFEKLHQENGNFAKKYPERLSS